MFDEDKYVDTIMQMNDTDLRDCYFIVLRLAIPASGKPCPIAVRKVELHLKVDKMRKLLNA